ncbi:hypothetical protein [Caballeronia sp.]
MNSSNTNASNHAQPTVRATRSLTIMQTMGIVGAIGLIGSMLLHWFV